MMCSICGRVGWIHNGVCWNCGKHYPRISIEAILEKYIKHIESEDPEDKHTLEVRQEMYIK